MSQLERDIFKALTIAKDAFWESIEKDGWDLNLEWSFSVRELDVEERTLINITIDNREARNHDQKTWNSNG